MQTPEFLNHRAMLSLLLVVSGVVMNIAATAFGDNTPTKSFASYILVALYVGGAITVLLAGVLGLRAIKAPRKWPAIIAVVIAGALASFLALALIILLLIALYSIAQ